MSFSNLYCFHDLHERKGSKGGNFRGGNLFVRVSFILRGLLGFRFRIFVFLLCLLPSIVVLKFRGDCIEDLIEAAITFHAMVLRGFLRRRYILVNAF